MKNLFTILFTISCFLTYAADLYVFPGGTAPNYSSVHTAVNAAADGDRVLVAPGTYIENVSMPATSLMIIPLADGGNYTISGYFYISAAGGDKKATIVGAIIQGNFQEVNNTVGSGGGSQINEFNFINCVFMQAFVPEIAVMTNIYYSTFHENCDGMFKEIIGNSFLNQTTNSKTSQCQVIKSTWSGASNTLYGDDKVLKVYGNHFVNTSLNIKGNNMNEWIEEVHVANNFFEHTDNPPYSGNGYSYYLLQFSSSGNYTIPEFLVENNTLSKNTGGNTQGWAYRSDGTYSTNIIRNNIYYANSGWSYQTSVFYFNCSAGIATVMNNLFNYSAWPSTVSTSYLSNGNNPYFSGSISGGSVSSSDNFFQPSFSSGDIDLNSRIVTNSNATNNGLDIMECRDIDDTQNDIGTWGGPHSWDNYHSTGTGKGRIIDIQMPSTIYGLPGVTFEVKSKAIRTN